MSRIEGIGKSKPKQFRVPPRIALTVTILFLIIWIIPVYRHGQLSLNAMSVGLTILGSAVLYWESIWLCDAKKLYLRELDWPTELTLSDISWWSGWYWIAVALTACSFVGALAAHKLGLGTIALGVLIPLMPIFSSLIIFFVARLNRWVAGVKTRVNDEILKSEETTDAEGKERHLKEAERLTRNMIKQLGFICYFLAGLLQLPSALFNA
ncbi:MAG TPA: hypothetical protein VM639_04930 [Dongiaceae bacterium]|nr:hypothetical protein [Dongiaceae bacterium]